MLTREQVLANFLRDEFSVKEAQRDILHFIFNDSIRNGEYEGNEYILKKLEPFTYVVYAEWTFIKEGRVEIANAYVFTRAERLSAMKTATGKDEEELAEMGR